MVTLGTSWNFWHCGRAEKLPEMSRSTRALGRWELLGWINDFLCLDQGKVEELSDGTAFCQLVDAVHPGKVPLHKLVWSARTQSERIKNLNVLEKAMRECGMNKSVSAEKIAGGSFPENLALLQFLHAYIQRNAPGAHLQHDPVQRRLEAMGHTASARNRNAEDRRELLHDAAWTLHEASGNATTSSPARSLKPSLVQVCHGGRCGRGYLHLRRRCRQTATCGLSYTLCVNPES